jgi:uncharacterized protein with HEPN domain
MSRTVLDRLKDIVRSTELAVQHAGSLDAVTLATADQQRDAPLYRIMVIGEAVSFVPPEIQALAAEIPWHRIENMRHRIVQGYWQVDFAIVVKTVALDLAPLKAAANRLIELLESAQE